MKQLERSRKEYLPNLLGFGRRSGGGGAAVPFTAQFGDSGNNAAGTGAFDTSLYTASVPADGTYGAFTVASGIITPSGAQTVGTYDVGGYPVEVVANLKAIANQTEHNALNGTFDKSKTILIREGAAVLYDNTAAGFLRRADALETIFLGDGPDVRLTMWDAGYDARRHYTRHVLAAMRNFTCRNLRISPTSKATAVNFTASSGGAVTTGDIAYEDCVVISSRPDPNGAYSTGVSSFPGSFGIYCTGTVTGLRLHDNVVIGAERGYRIVAAAYFENIGNESWLSYEDGYSLSVGGCPTLTAGAIMGTGLARPADTGNPHGDGLQILPDTPTVNHVLEASAVFAGNHRGRSYNQTLFLSNSTNGYQTHMRDCLVVDDPIYNFTIENTIGSVMEHCARVPTPYATLPNNPSGIRFGSAAPVTGTNILRNCLSLAGGAVDASVTQTGNVNTTGYLAADWVAMFENWTVDSTAYPSLQKIMTDLKAKAGGPGAGKGHRVTFTGSKNSEFAIDGGLAAPTLSALTITSTTAASASATVTSDTALNPVFWAVVPTGTAVPNPRDIKRRKIATALVYGFTSMKNGDTSATLNLSGALVAATTYDLVCEQENGWTAVSSVARVTFTAT